MHLSGPCDATSALLRLLRSHRVVLSLIPHCSSSTPAVIEYGSSSSSSNSAGSSSSELSDHPSAEFRYNLKQPVDDAGASCSHGSSSWFSSRLLQPPSSSPSTSSPPTWWSLQLGVTAGQGKAASLGEDDLRKQTGSSGEDMRRVIAWLLPHTNSLTTPIETSQGVDVGQVFAAVKPTGQSAHGGNLDSGLPHLYVCVYLRKRLACSSLRYA